MPHSALHDAIADSVAASEAVVERHIQARSERVVELLLEPSERDPEIWGMGFAAAAEAGAPLEVSDWDMDADELNEVPRESRGFRWQAVWQSLISCAQAQADAEIILRPLWAVLERSEMRVAEEGARLMRPLSREAVRGPGRARFDAARERARGGAE